ncbi:MAG TPA: VCBS repeat-containing protein, partial [Chitinophagaceae bacterium]|nr:VCBS repeat-containing protein [Chitinophagaceae bacterium]
DISHKAGLRQDSLWSTGVVMADINGDGWLDIYVCSSGRISDGKRINKLYINNHDLTFTELAAQYGINHSGYCTQASFFDYDMDGDLDCLLINNSPIPFGSLNYAEMRDTDISKWNVNDNLKGGGNHLYRNDNGHFNEVTKQAGLHTGLISFGLGVSVGDLNGDNYTDIYVGNDFIEKDYLYINQKNGTFKDELEERIQKISMSSMSSDLADINNDGYPEIFTTDMIPDDDYRLKTTGTFDNIDLYLSKQKAGLYHQYVRNSLQLNNRNGTFSEIADYTGTAGTDWSWGALMFDADNDGLNDIFVCNGINKDLGDLDFLDFVSNDVYKQMMETGKKEDINEILKHIPVNQLPNRVFKNNGNLQFTDIGNAWGLGQPSFSNSVAYGDLDNDGDLELIVNNENQPAFVYKNNSREQNSHNNYIGIVLKGKGLNTFAIGSKIKLYHGDQVYYRELVPSRGFQSSVDYKQIIGLGTTTRIDSMIVIWPDRSYSRYEHPELNKVHVLQQPDKGIAVPENITTVKTLLEPVAVTIDKHSEDDYVDFYYERNLPEILSREGPRIAKADVNGDGLEDVYIGGAQNQAGQLYVQTAIGFVKKEETIFKEFAGFEDVAVLLFDADKDGDLDLYIGAGGNNVRPNSRELQHRLYKNDGKGNFSIDTKSFPNNNMNISVAVANDYDGDGDEDLFVGSRSVPYSYGVTPQSYLYQNDGQGHFSDVTAQLNAELRQLGMITGAVWSDINGDKQKELIITGEWMTPRIFQFQKQKNKFEELKQTNLDHLYGCWQTIAAADINGDGKTDLVIGNIGENFYLRPDAKNPVKLWVNDFDNSGTTDQFLTRTVNGRDMPVFLKREVTDQFPGLKKQNLKHSDYARKSIQDLFPEAVIKSAEVKQFNYNSSVVAINDGQGGFSIQKLPLMVQLSSVNAIESMDINGDNQNDLLLGGNMFGFPPQFGRLDASYGHVLINEGKGVLKWTEPQKSGVSLRGEIKDIKAIQGKEKRYILIVQNNEYPVLYQVNNHLEKKKK